MSDRPLRVLIVEDSEDDELLIIRQLKKGGYNPLCERVETSASMKNTLKDKPWDIILCDYSLPKFNAPSAIAVLKELNIDIPIIIVSGTMGEETAVECMRLGAQDYIVKSNLSRLCPAINRELEKVKVRDKGKLVEEKLKQSEERYKALFDRSLDLVCLHDLGGRFIDANDAALTRLGYTREEIRSLNFASLLSEDQLPLAYKTIEDMLNGVHVGMIELRLRHKNGTDVYVESQGSIVMANGKPVAIQSIIRDITERKLTDAVLKRTLESLRKAFGTIIKVLVSAVEAKDPYTAGHQLRSADLARAIATEMGLSSENIDGIRMASSVHDIGKISVPSEILTKPTKLSNIEFSMIKEHSQIGYDLLKDVESPWPLAQIVYQHHERMNGSGYPRHLKGDEIILSARIMAVADVVESMASHRPYRPSLGIEAALEEIEKNKGILYDDVVGDACLKLFREKGYQLP